MARPGSVQAAFEVFYGGHKIGPHGKALFDYVVDLETELAATKAQNERLIKLNANLMGDDESLPRYTTKRLKHEIKEARNKALDEAKAIIVNNAINQGRDGQSLQPRYEGDQFGMAYATAIEALKEQGHE